MERLHSDSDTLTLVFPRGEVVTINNALNEVCNGLKMPDFEARIGVRREEAVRLLRLVHTVLENTYQKRSDEP